MNYSIYLIVFILANINFVRVSCESNFAGCFAWNSMNISQTLALNTFSNISCNLADFTCIVQTCFLNDGFGIFLLVGFSTLVLLIILITCAVCFGLPCMCISFCILRRKHSTVPSPLISRYTRRGRDLSFQNSNLGTIDRSIILSETSDHNKSQISDSIMYESFHLGEHTMSNSAKNPGKHIKEMKNAKPKYSRQKKSSTTAEPLPTSTSTTGLTIGNDKIGDEGYGFDGDSVVYEEVLTIYEAFEKGKDLNQENDSMSRMALDTNVKKDWKTATIVLSNSERGSVGNNYDCVFRDAPKQSSGETTYFRRESQFMNPSTDISTIFNDMADLKIREINRKTLSFDEKLGHGNFAIVYKGTWASNYGDIPVAVKVINKHNQTDQLVGVLREAAAMAQFDHPNILKLLGVVTLGNPCVIVSELMKDQLVYFLYKLNRSPIAKSKFPSLLLKFCSDICLGMEYLAGMKFVHRDLAARNVLVAMNLNCRIADFGLCRELKKELDYYKASGGSIAVRWAAPESVFYQRYNEQSDVWSFGMTMYEIWTLGVKPWHTLTTEAVIDILLKHSLPTPPTGCPPNIYELMIEIWNQDPESRPSFKEIKHKLKAIKLPTPTSAEPAHIPGNDPALAKDMYPTLQKKYAHK